jgi:undecaprenyl diphosphate synthase
MDGNGRWAAARHLPRVAGHQAGVSAVKAIIKACIQENIPALTLFAFSCENWQRPEQEVTFLMDLFLHTLQNNLDELHGHGVRIRFIGERTAFSQDMQRMMRTSEKQTADNTAVNVNIAMNYSGRWDITQALVRIAKAVKNDCIHLDEIDENVIGHHTALSELPPPDLFIRTSGEYRISNFMLWQLAYTELYFTQVYWPDFDAQAFKLALEDYAKRDRRFGKVSTDNPSEADAYV